jgi:hypothetical protein
VRAFGHGAVDGKPSPGYQNSNPRLKLDYLNQKRDTGRKIAELLLTGRWPPDYRGEEIRIPQIGRAFRLTELAVVRSHLPDFDFGEFSKADQQDIVDVLNLFGDIWIFEHLPYGTSGKDALERMRR